MAKVGKGIDVNNLNLAISLVLPKNCSAHKGFIELHRFFISSFTDLNSQTKSLKDKIANL